jgi:hypothetical protein
MVSLIACTCGPCNHSLAESSTQENSMLLLSGSLDKAWDPIGTVLPRQYLLKAWTEGPAPAKPRILSAFFRQGLRAVLELFVMFLVLDEDLKCPHSSRALHCACQCRPAANALCPKVEQQGIPVLFDTSLQHPLLALLCSAIWEDTQSCAQSLAGAGQHPLLRSVNF